MVSPLARWYPWLPGLSAVAAVVVFAWLLVIDWRNQERDWQMFLQQEQRHQIGLLTSQERAQSNLAQLLAQMIATDPAFIAAVRSAHQLYQEEQASGTNLRTQQARQQLYSQLDRDWKRMQALGAIQLSLFFSPGAVNFVRMSRSERFGDSVAGVRPLVTGVFSSGTAALGVDVNHEGSAYSALLPITADAQGAPVIAVLEVSFSILPAYLEPGTDMAVFLRKSSLDSLLWEQSIQRMNKLSQTTVDIWRLERTSSPLLLEWWSRGQIPIGRGAQQLAARDKRQYLVSWTERSRTGLAEGNPELALALWSDVSDQYRNYLQRRQQSLWRWVGLALGAELLLLLFWQLAKGYIRGLMALHDQSLKREVTNSEQARQRLALALRSSESGFWEWDIVHDKASFSPEWRQLCGLPPATSGAQDLDEWMSRVHPADKRASYSDMIRHIKGETPMYENEYRLRVGDGSYKWIHTRGRVVEWQPDGKAALMLGVYSDVTQRKNMELITIRQQAALHSLNEIASLSSVDPDEQLRQALALAVRYLGLTNGAISESSMGRYLVRIQYSLRELEELPDSLPLSQTYCSLTLAAKDVVAEDNIPQSSLADHPAFKRSKQETYIGVPLWIEGELFGTLSFSARKSRQHEYDRLDKDFVRLLARWISSVVERWQQDKDKKEILDRFHKLSERVPGFLYQYQLRPDGSSFFPYASPGIKSIYHLSPEDVREDASKVFEVLHPDDVGWVSETVSYSATHLTPWVATVRVNHPERGLIWTHVQSIPERLPDGSVLWNGYVSDITSLKQTELELEQINALNRAIFDAASVSIISTDENGIIKTFNHGAELMLGYSADEMIDSNTPGILHLPEEMARRAQELERELGYKVPLDFDVFIAKAREGMDDENEWTYKRKDGSVFPVMLTVSALRDLDGEIFGYLGIGRDITELKRIDKMKAEFISTVSHELRTPLTAISGALGILDSGSAGEISAAAKRMIGIAHSNAQRLILIVNDLLDMEKLVAGKMHFELQEQSLLPLVQHSLDANSAYAQRFQVSYQLAAGADDARVNVDALRLQQVLANYLSNAAKFSPKGEVIEIRVERRFGSVRVGIKDKGPGIPDAFRARIFQKFSQADSSDTRSKGGTGLGLAICKEIIERMGGKVGFSSVYGQGAEFYFDLPCEDTTQRVSSSSVEPERPRHRLLIVEDDESISNLWQSMLRRAGYELDAVDSGASALEYLALRRYDLLVLDLNLPDVYGVEILSQIRESESPYADDPVPILVISGAVEAGKAKCPPQLLERAVYWRQKPIKMAEFLATVAELLHKFSLAEREATALALEAQAQSSESSK